MNDLLLQKTFKVTKDLSLWSRLEGIGLEPDEVHVWCLDLKVGQNDLDYLFCLLADDEKNKARRFRIPKAHEAFIARRGLLRILLSRYLGGEARALRFTYNAFDKPILESASESYGLHFNVSHADDIALIAVSRNDVGIDIERVDIEYPCLTIAKEFFAPREVSALRALSPSEVAHAFFRYWTAKEAIAKATGQGLSVPLDKIELNFSEKKDAGYANVLFSTCDVWHFYQLELVPNFIVALASRNAVQHVIYSGNLELRDVL
jgi:4'-phosphopantetheinyl transferase